MPLADQGHALLDHGLVWNLSNGRPLGPHKVAILRCIKYSSTPFKLYAFSLITNLNRHWSHTFQISEGLL